MLSIRAKDIWFKTIGQHDLVVLKFYAYDTQAEGIKYLTAAFKIGNGQTFVFPEGARRLWGPAPVKGKLKIYGELTVMKPGGWNNVRDALQQLDKAAGAGVSKAGEATGNPYLIVAGAIHSVPEINKLYADVTKVCHP